MKKIISVLIILAMLSMTVIALPIGATGDEPEQNVGGEINDNNGGEENTPGGDTEGGDTEGGDTEDGDTEGGDTEGGDTEGGEPVVKPEVDFSKLDAKIAEIEALNPRDWHSRFLLYLTMAVDDAKELKEDPKVNQYKVNDALQKIEKAQKNLVPKPTPTPLEEITLEEYEQWINEGLELHKGDSPKHTMRPKPTAAIPANIVTLAADGGKGGCGSIIGGAALIVVSAVAVGAGVILKKKED